MQLGTGVRGPQRQRHALAATAYEVNLSVENIGARRLHTILELVLDEISFEATDRPGTNVIVDAAYVDGRLGELSRNEDLSRYIL